MYETLAVYPDVNIQCRFHFKHAALRFFQEFEIFDMHSFVLQGSLVGMMMFGIFASNTTSLPDNNIIISNVTPGNSNQAGSEIKSQNISICDTGNADINGCTIRTIKASKIRIAYLDSEYNTQNQAAMKKISSLGSQYTFGQSCSSVDTAPSEWFVFSTF